MLRGSQVYIAKLNKTASSMGHKESMVVVFSVFARFMFIYALCLNWTCPDGFNELVVVALPVAAPSGLSNKKTLAMCAFSYGLQLRVGKYNKNWTRGVNWLVFRNWCVIVAFICYAKHFLFLNYISVSSPLWVSIIQIMIPLLLSK